MIPGTLYTYVATAILSMSIGATGAWKVQNLRIDAKEKEHAEQQLVSERELHKFDNHRSTVAAAAQNDGIVRAVQLRADADGSRGALVRLRESTDAALQAASTSLDTCTHTATTLSDLFYESTERYSEMAATAGRHASDVQTLTEAWPK